MFSQLNIRNAPETRLGLDVGSVCADILSSIYVYLTFYLLVIGQTMHRLFTYSSLQLIHSTDNEALLKYFYCCRLCVGCWVIMTWDARGRVIHGVGCFWTVYH